MSQRVKTSARGLVLPWSSSLENGHLRKKKHTNLTLVNERQNNVTSCTNYPYLMSTLIIFHWMSINLGQFVFYCFSTFCQLNVCFSNTGLKFNKRIFFEYRKYFIRQRWLPVTEGHLTPPSPEAFPHNASLYVIINYTDRWRYYLVTW